MQRATSSQQMFKALSVHDGMAYATAVTTAVPNCPESRRAILAQLLRDGAAAPSARQLLRRSAAAPSALPSAPAPRLVDATNHWNTLATSPLFCSVDAHRIAHGATETDGLETIVDAKLEREQRETEHTPEAQHERGRAPNAPLLGHKLPNVTRSSMAFVSPMGLPSVPRTRRALFRPPATPEFSPWTRPRAPHR